MPSARPTNGLADITPGPRPSEAAASRTPPPSFCIGSLTAANATEGRIEFRGPRHEQDGNLTLTTITRLLDDAELYQDDADPGVAEAGIAIGGAALTLALELDAGLPGGGMTEMTALYGAPGGAAWVPLGVEPLGSGRSITIPDRPGMAQLRLDVIWTDGCFEYAGSVRFDFEVIASAVVAVCPSDAAGLTAVMADHADDMVAVKDIYRSIGTLGFSARYFSFSAEQGQPFPTWDPAAPRVQASTGELLAVEDDDPDLRLTRGIARFFLLNDPNTTRPDDAVPVSETSLEPDATGRLQIEGPTEPGRYLLELRTSLELDCLDGSGIAYYTVDVGRVVGSLPRPSV
jgi:hypothetical protein